MKPPFITMLMQTGTGPGPGGAHLPFTCNASRVTETATHFLHQVDLSAALSNATFKAAVTDRSSLVIQDDLGNPLPSKMILDLTGDTLFAYFDGPKSTSASTTFHLYASPDFTEVDSTAAFTNCGITNFWGFDETSGTTAHDYAGSVDITLNGMTLNNTGLFGGSTLSDDDTDWAASSLNPDYAGASSMVLSMTMKRNASGQEKTTVRYGNFSAAPFLFQFGGDNTIFVYLNGPRITTTEAVGAPGAYHSYTAVFNGSLSGSDRIKLYYDGALKSTSTYDSFPTTMPYDPYPVYIGHDGGWGQVANYDNIYIKSSATVGFITDTYRSLFEPSTFYTLGEVG